MKTLMPKVLLTGIALALPLLGLAQGNGTEVSGTVTDPSRGVMAGTSVTLRDTKGASLQSVTTDARGNYSLKGVAPGSYVLLVFRDGFAPVTDEIRVDSAPLRRDFVLKVAGFAEEVTVSFTGDHARTALKMDAPVRDVPLSVKSYATSFVKALDATNVGDLYTYMNGVNRTGLGVTDAAMRGFTFTVESFNIAYNGMPGAISRNNASNTANLERIELLKGPASVLYGKSAPGGLVNLITKRPQSQPGYVADLRFGSFAGTGSGFGDANSYRVAMDLTGPIGGGSQILYRLIGSYDSNHSFRAFVESRDVFVTPSLTWNISSSAALTVEGEYRNVKGRFDSGLIAPQNDISLVAPITTRYQEPDDLQRDEGWAVSAYLTKAFGGGWGLNVNWRTAYQDDQRSGFESNSVLADARTVRRRDRDQVNSRGSNFLDTTVSKSVRTGGVSHSVLFGLGGGQTFTEGDRRRFGNLGFNIDIYNPVYGLYPRPANGRPNTHRGLYRWNYNGYVQDRIDLGSHWKALFALRYDRWDTDYRPLRLPDVTPPGSRTDTGWLPMGGLVFQPDGRWSLYGSVSSSFEPVANISDTNPVGDLELDPERGRQYEAGVKTELAQGRVETTLALFRIVKHNVKVPLGPDVVIQTGEQRSQGMELDLRLKPAQHFQAILGYTYTDAKITKDTRPQLIGNRLRNAAKHNFNVWGRYDVPSGAARGLGFGLGLIRRGDRAGSAFLTPQRLNAPAFVLLPAYFRADAALYLVRGRSELTLRGSNLLDRIYYEAGNSTTGILAGRPREVTLSLRVRL